MADEHTPPDLIICNFNLPKRTGAQVLAEVERDANVKRIPFIMLTSSTRDTERDACAGAKAYLIKGSTWADALAIAKQIVAFLSEEARKHSEIGIAADTDSVRSILSDVVQLHQTTAHF
jgi:CheY-like chemotaxis protein